MPQNQLLALESTTFPVSAAGPDLKFQELRLADPVSTGRQIVDAYVVEFGLDQTIDLRGHKDPRFIIAKSDRLFLFEIDDKQGAWPEPTITRKELLAVAGQDPAKFTVWQERKKEQDLEDRHRSPGQSRAGRRRKVLHGDEQDHGGRAVSVLPSKCRKYLTDAEVAHIGAGTWDRRAHQCCSPKNSRRRYLRKKLPPEISAFTLAKAALPTSGAGR
jgi:hypothetical protein